MCTRLFVLHEMQFAAMMRRASGEDDDGDGCCGGDGIPYDRLERDTSPTWAPDTPSPLDRYPSGAPIFDFAEGVEARIDATRGTRSNRPRRGQGDRAGVARADIPRTSKSSRGGGRVRARSLEQMKERLEKYDEHSSRTCLCAAMRVRTWRCTSPTLFVHSDARVGITLHTAHLLLSWE